MAHDTNLQRKSTETANPSRKALQTVQVTATPKRVRRPKDIGQATPTHHYTPFIRAGQEDLVPPSSGFRVPSSAVRPPPSFVPGTDLRSTSRLRNGQGVAETPSRGSGKTASFFTDAGQLEKLTEADTRHRFSLSGCSSGPLLSEKTSGETAIFQTPSKPRARRLDRDTLDINSSTIFATPVKTVTPKVVEVATSAKSAPILDTPVKAAAFVNTSIFTIGPKSPRADIFTTPVKSASKGANAVATTSAASTSDASQGKGEEKSIYEALGWDDDEIS